MALVLTNNASTILADEISSIATSMTVADASSFPPAGGGDYFYCTLERTTGPLEIVKVTETNGEVFTIERGQESTIAISFPSASRVELRVTVQNIADSFSSSIVDGSVTYAKLATAAVATAAEGQAGTASKLLNAANTVTAGNVETITYAAFVALNFTTFVNARITLTGTLNLSAPVTTGMSGRSGWLELVQDSTGNRLVTWDSAYKFIGGSDIALSTAANAVDLIFYAILSDGTVYVSVANDVRN